MRWRSTVTAWALCVSLLLGGCGVSRDGWLGIGRAGDGSLRVYLRSCSQPLDGVTLYWPDDPKGPSREQQFAEWKIDSEPRGPLRLDWPLLGSSGEHVRSTDTINDLPAEPMNMAIYAWTEDATTSADGPYQFTASDLLELRPGQMLVDNTTGLPGDPPTKIVDLSYLDGLDCSIFR